MGSVCVEVTQWVNTHLNTRLTHVLRPEFGLDVHFRWPSFQNCSASFEIRLESTWNGKIKYRFFGICLNYIVTRKTDSKPGHCSVVAAYPLSYAGTSDVVKFSFTISCWECRDSSALHLWIAYNLCISSAVAKWCSHGGVHRQILKQWGKGQRPKRGLWEDMHIAVDVPEDICGDNET